MDEVRELLGKIYEEFGLNEVTLRVSEFLDIKIVQMQKEKIKNDNVCGNKC
jgi:hypothetical protein